jgi:hypothetical protein
MNTRTAHRFGLDAASETSQYFLSQEDLTLPIAAKTPLCDLHAKLQNQAQMQVRILMKRRVLIRFYIEARTTIAGCSVYRRLKQRSVTLSVGSVEEAERAIDAVLSFAMSLDGKHLVDQQDTHSQAISSESAPNP